MTDSENLCRHIDFFSVRSYGNKIAIGFKDGFTYDFFRLYEVRGGDVDLVLETEDFQTTFNQDCLGREYRVEGYVGNKLVGISGIWRCKLIEIAPRGTTLSIIIPVYNNAELLVRCLDSILMQSFVDFEVICVDDSSDDNITCEVLTWYSNTYPFIKAIHLDKNEGPGHARNVGLDAARGIYIAFVDGDDLVRYDMYSKLSKALVESNADIAVCRALGRKPHGGTEIILEHGRRGVYGYDKMVSMRGEDNDIFYPGVWNKLMRTELARKSYFPDRDHGYDNNMCYEDTAYTTSVYTHADKFAFVDEPLYIWDRRDRADNKSFCSRYDFEGLDRYMHFLYAITMPLEAGRPDRLGYLAYIAAKDMAIICRKAKADIRNQVLVACAEAIIYYGLPDYDMVRRDRDVMDGVMDVLRRAGRIGGA